MAISPDQIDAWRRLPTETERIEFKEAKAQFDNQKLYQYCVAIGNEGGGYLGKGSALDIPSGYRSQKSGARSQNRSRVGVQ